MALVKIVCPDLSDKDAAKRQIVPNWGTQVFIDGHELHDVCSVKVDIGIDSAATVRVEMFVSPGSEIELPAAMLIERYDPSLKE